MSLDQSEREHLSEGIDEARVAAWLMEHVPQLEPPLRFELLSGGRSNLTFEVRDASGRRAVLRRPPRGHVLESAHDMAREYRIIAALHETPVPVPEPLGICTDGDVNGAPFYLMAHVDGVVARDAPTAEAAVPEAVRPAAARNVVDVLAALHAVDPDAVGLGTLGRREAYAERQLRRWRRQWEQARTRAVPAVDEAYRLLATRVPEQRSVGIVHGDYRIDNLVLGADGSVRAVLDWELCTLGDPLADLAMLLLYWVEPGEPTDHLLSGTPTAVPGFGSCAAALGRYVDQTGADVSSLDFHAALALWKLACIAEGIHARYRSGAMGADAGADVDWYAERVPRLAQHALRVLAEGMLTEDKGGSR